MNNLKECIDCKTTKPIEDFRKYNSNGYIYYRPWCIECERIRYKSGGKYNKHKYPKHRKTILEKMFNI